MSAKTTTLVFFLLAVTAALLPTVSAHGRLVNPQPLVDRDIRVLRRGQPNRRGPCGIQDMEAAINAAQPLQVTPGQPNTFTWRITNGDGAGPITAAIDPTGTGQSFPLNVPVTQQVPGENGRLRRARRQNVNFTLDMPADMQCNPRCVLRITQPTGFGSCGVLTTAPGAGAGNGDNNNNAGEQQQPGQGQDGQQPKQPPAAGNNGPKKQAPRRMNMNQSAKKSMSA